MAAGIRGQLAHELVELLRRDSDEILAGIEELIGQEIAELRRVLRAGVTSIAQANQAVSSALTAIDLMTPDVAWRRLRSTRARRMEGLIGLTVTPRRSPAVGMILTPQHAMDAPTPFLARHVGDASTAPDARLVLTS